MTKQEVLEKLRFIEGVAFGIGCSIKNPKLKECVYDLFEEIGLAIEMVEKLNIAEKE